MLCIKKNKCFVLRKINAFQLCCYYRKKKQTAYCNPFRPVETRSDLLKPVETRFNPFRLTRLNLSKHVQTCWNTLQSVQTRFPSLPLPPSPPKRKWKRGEEGGWRRGRGGSLETGLDRSERIETCFDRFQQVWTDWNVFRQVQTCFNRSGRIVACFNGFHLTGTHQECL